ncbi:hypothetical protein F4009_05325 [Candidatus Poribacteria bacterium]|nr:hypothetical protein [Candidatus Poribacteria bacterium]
MYPRIQPTRPIEPDESFYGNEILILKSGSEDACSRLVPDWGHGVTASFCEDLIQRQMDVGLEWNG